MFNSSRLRTTIVSHTPVRCFFLQQQSTTVRLFQSEAIRQQYPRLLDVQPVLPSLRVVAARQCSTKYRYSCTVTDTFLFSNLARLPSSAHTSGTVSLHSLTATAPLGPSARLRRVRECDHSPRLLRFLPNRPIPIPNFRSCHSHSHRGKPVTCQLPSRWTRATAAHRTGTNTLVFS